MNATNDHLSDLLRRESAKKQVNPEILRAPHPHKRVEMGEPREALIRRLTEALASNAARPAAS